VVVVLKLFSVVFVLGLLLEEEEDLLVIFGRVGLG